ncbi:MAG: hypothetical protein KME45_26925 [Stenomitos rutilans HA7619-LM2]|jgi:hypothetical protein|nr:hypothetical protein [Stenomitos rutilans HA7619-LM2]
MSDNDFARLLLIAMLVFGCLCGYSIANNYDFKGGIQTNFGTLEFEGSSQNRDF